MISCAVISVRIAALYDTTSNSPSSLTNRMRLIDATVVVRYRVRLPLPVVQYRAHEFVGHADAVVGVLEEDGCIRRPGERTVVARINQCPRLLLFLDLAVDELDDVGM